MAFFRAISRLIVVGDGNLWRKTSGLLRTLLAQAESAEDQDASDLDMDEPLAKLYPRQSHPDTDLALLRRHGRTS